MPSAAALPGRVRKASTAYPTATAASPQKSMPYPWPPSRYSPKPSCGQSVVPMFSPSRQIPKIITCRSSEVSSESSAAEAGR